MELFIQIVGWIGTFLVVCAYFLVSNKKVSSTSSVYQLMNLFGAIGVGINVYYAGAWPSVALQVIWGIISITALSRIYKNN
jgi:hypothetical protein